MASVQNVLFRTYFRLTTNKKKAPSYTINKVRTNLNKLIKIAIIPKAVRFEKIDCNGVEVEATIPDNVQNVGAVVYLHGGAYVAGSTKTHRALVARLAIASKTKFYSVEYSLAPEKPFPHGLNDSIKTYNWLIEKGFDHKKIVFCGDSAGGGLAICSLVKIRDEGLPQPAAGAVMSPWLDLLCAQDSAVRLAKEDVMISVEAGKNHANLYAKNELKNPHVSPLHGNPKGLPPIYIQVSTSETLLDDSVEFGKKAKSAGVDIIVEPWDKMIHVWQAFSPYLPEGTKAIKKLGAYIIEKTK